jgi:hypothetical protein
VTSSTSGSWSTSLNARSGWPGTRSSAPGPNGSKSEVSR